ncbi:MAG TPA: hypothetical protein DCF33_10890 [Saprospirales bacterium]|nr:hypothetical protein [Saprospirales bacterium]
MYFCPPKGLLWDLIIQLSAGLTYDALGAVFDCDGSTAKINQTLALPILQASLTQMGLMPKREFSSVEDFEAYFAKHDTLLVDFGILREEFPPQKTWFARFNIRLDLGFLGFSELYPCRQLYIPFKKPRKNDLSQEA